jgi:galactokinase
MDPQLIKKAYTKYSELFNSKPERIVFAPGRVNLIGEHTDYSDGFVFPLAINMGIVIAFTSRNDDELKLFSLDFDENIDQRISTFEKEEAGWREYIKGVAWALHESGYELKGFQGVFTGDLPIGAGLSSSAALEVAAAEAFCIASDIKISKRNLAKVCQKAEREYVGVNVGIMDQFISALGRSGCAVQLDCRTLGLEYFPIPENACLVVMDTNTRRELSHSEYNTRHREVEKAADILGVTHLRDATYSLLQNFKDQLPSPIYNRTRHVITENDRVHAFGSAMEANDLQRMGELLNESHKSLRRDFEVSSRELDIIVQLSQDQNECYGARMTGAGFGGCALALIEKGAIETFTKKVTDRYFVKIGIRPNIFKVESTDGVHAVTYDGN